MLSIATDWNPLIVAAAGLLVLLGPSLAGYVNYQVKLLGLRVEAVERQAAADRTLVVGRLDKLDATVKSTAVATQAAVKEQKGNGS